jgi:phosphatidylglycerol---prolipoprotein diacylglyceryl transferase
VVLAINWDVGAELVDGWKTPNLYGLLFVTGLIIGYFVVRRMYKQEGISDVHLDKLVLYMVIATIVGARLGHVLFYGPYLDVVHPNGYIEEGYFSHPMNILKIWEGGLASHGGAMAIFVALVIYSRRVVKKPLMWILDRIAAPIAIAGSFIRLGNLVNHEIVGDPTTVPWGFRFLHHDCYEPYDCAWADIPIRHPAQLYEAICYIFLFALLLYMYWKRNSWAKPGVIFGTFLIVMFSARFLIEFVKLGQTDRDDIYMINTGQMLSIPFIIGGAYVLWRGLKKNQNKNQLDDTSEA